MILYSLMIESCLPVSSLHCRQPLNNLWLSYHHSAQYKPDIYSKEASHRLFDSIRGSNKALYSNSNSAEAAGTSGYIDRFVSTGPVTKAESDGDIIDVNVTGEDFVIWNWKAGGTAVSNTDGTITSSVSANTTAGFSIASYTGTGSAATIGHGLSSAPELIIVKNRDQTDAWQVGSSKGIDFTDYLVLNTNAAAVDNVDRWNDTAPSASVFTIGDGVEVNTNTEDYIAYCFHSIPGYSKVSGYTAAGSDGDMNFLYCGFRPAFVLFKETSATNPWAIIDNKRNTYNLADLILRPNASDAVYSHSSGVDFVSNGIKLINNNGMWGDAAADYIFYAIAESPFKTSNAR